MALNKISLAMLENKVLVEAQPVGGALKLTYSDGTSVTYTPSGTGTGGASLPTTIDNISPDASAHSTPNGVNVYMGGPKLWDTKAGVLIQQTASGAGTIPLVVSGVIGGTQAQATTAYFGGGGLTSGLGGYCGLTSESSPPDWKGCTILGHAGSDGKFFGQLSYGFAGGGAARFVQWNVSNASLLASAQGKQVDICTDSYGIQLYGTQIASFTGAHDGLYSKALELPSPGDIVVDYRVVNALSINDVVTEVRMSDKPYQKNALGVFVEVCQDTHIPSALAQFIQNSKQVTSREAPPDLVVQLITEFADIGKSMHFVAVNAVGEGMINVCSEGGNFEAGDLVVTSSTPGKGMKQSDDVIRASTVAKVRESVIFEDKQEIKMVPCIYLCG